MMPPFTASHFAEFFRENPFRACVRHFRRAMRYAVSLTRKVRLGVLGSGKGSNLDALAKYCARAESAMEISFVVSDVENAEILSLPKSRGQKPGLVPPGNLRRK